MHFYYHVSIFFFENAIFSNVLSFFLSIHLHLYFLLFANLFGFQTFPNLVFQAPFRTCTWQEWGGGTTPQQANNNITRRGMNINNTRQGASNNKGRLSEYLNKQQ